jgi:hypothetical protein
MNQTCPHSWSILCAGGELDSRILSRTYFSLLDPSMHFFSPRAVVNFISTVDDPADSVLLDLPSLQRKLHIHCMCNCILLELLILPCNIVYNSSDNTFPIAVWIVKHRLKP